MSSDLPQPLRVAHVIGSYAPATYHGGPITSTTGLCEHLATLGCEVRVLTTDANGPGERIAVPMDREVERNSVVVRYCHSLTDRPFSPRLLQRLPAHVEWADVVHVTGVYEHHTMPALWACRQRARGVVWSPRGSLQRWERVRHRTLKAVWERACRTVLPAASAVHVTAEPEAEAARRRLPGVPVHVVPNGITLPERPCDLEASGDDGLRLLFLGRLDPIKGLEALLEACTLCESSPRLAIAGSGDDAYRRHLERLVSRLDLGARVELLGYCAGPEKDALWRTTDALVLPSFSENFGMVVAEALARGRPVIAARGTPWAGLVERDCGLWVSNEPASLAEAMDALAARRDRARMGARGRAWMRDELAWPSVARRMLEVYRATVAAAGRSPSLSPNHQAV